MGYKTNNRWIKVNRTLNGKPYFKHKGKRYYLDDFIRCHDNPWIGTSHYPSYIHGYYAREYYHPMYIEIERRGEAVKVYRETEDPKFTTYSLRNYFDVWGNEKDGWEVNNSCIEFDDLNISDDATEKEILKYLKDINFLITDDMRKVRCDMNTYVGLIEIYAVKGHRPIAALIENVNNGNEKLS